MIVKKAMQKKNRDDIMQRRRGNTSDGDTQAATGPRKDTATVKKNGDHINANAEAGKETGKNTEH